MFQHVTYGDLPFEVVEAEAGAEGELGHVDNLDCKVQTAVDEHIFTDEGKSPFPANWENNVAWKYGI